MAAKIKKKGKKNVSKPHAKKVVKGRKERDDTDEIIDLERDVDRGEDEETGAVKVKGAPVVEKEDPPEEDTGAEDDYEYGERGILSDEDESEDNY
jgi:hypothetical protein